MTRFSGDTPIFDETARDLDARLWPATDGDFLPEAMGAERDCHGEEWPGLDG